MSISVDKALTKAAKHIRKGEINAAATLYQEILTQYPGNARARRELESLNARISPIKPPREEYERLVQLYEAAEMDEVVERATLMSRRYPTASIVFNILGLAHAAQENWAAAIESYQKALRHSPGLAELHNNLGIALQKNGDHSAAREAYRHALKISPGMVDALNNLALLLIDEKKYDEAIVHLEDVLKRQPDFDEARKNLIGAYGDKGRLHSQRGQSEKARQAFEKALELGPREGKIFLSYTHVTKVEPGNPYLERMIELADPDILTGDEASAIQHALANAYFALGDAGKAFQHLNEGNRLQKADLQYDIREDVERHSEFRGYFDTIGPQEIEYEDDLGFTPVFILGMPRSGTTLTEQILACHPNCFAGGEMHELSDIVRTTAWYFDERRLEAFKAVRGAYRDAVKEKTGKPFVTDKMPFNFRIIGFIAYAFPEAKIIHMRRKPEAVCWSNYRTDFHARTMGYSCDMVDVAHYYRLYEEMMTYWQKRFPGRIYEQNYEALTENFGPEVRALLNHVGLDWTDAVMEFHKNDRPVLTASSAQVRRKLYSGSSDAWEKYREFLFPMLDALNTKKEPLQR